MSNVIVSVLILVALAIGAAVWIFLGPLAIAAYLAAGVLTIGFVAVYAMGQIYKSMRK